MRAGSGRAGFNQAAALGREIARRAGKPFEPALLRRIKATRSQVGLSREQRVQNMQGAFRAAPAASVQGRRIALVDDVLTSGATANAAARALLRAGAAQVDLIVFAEGCDIGMTSHIIIVIAESP